MRDEPVLARIPPSSSRFHNSPISRREQSLSKWPPHSFLRNGKVLPQRDDRVPGSRVFSRGTKPLTRKPASEFNGFTHPCQIPTSRPEAQTQNAANTRDRFTASRTVSEDKGVVKWCGVLVCPGLVFPRAQKNDNLEAFLAPGETKGPSIRTG